MFIVQARNNFESTRAEVERLMKRIRSAEEDFQAPSCFTMEGYLYIQEKREIHRNHIVPSLSVSFPAYANSSASACKRVSCISRSAGQCVDQVLLHVWEKLQDVHHEQHRDPTSQQTGELAAQTNDCTSVDKCFQPIFKKSCVKIYCENSLEQTGGMLLSYVNVVLKTKVSLLQYNLLIPNTEYQTHFANTSLYNRMAWLTAHQRCSGCARVSGGKPIPSTSASASTSRWWRGERERLCVCSTSVE